MAVRGVSSCQGRSEHHTTHTPRRHVSWLLRSSTQSNVLQLSWSFLRTGETMSLRNCAPDGPILHLPDDVWVTMEERWNYTDRGYQRTRSKTYPSGPSLNKNPTCTDLRANLGLHGEKEATNRLRYSRDKRFHLPLKRLGRTKLILPICCNLTWFPLQYEAVMLRYRQQFAVGLHVF